MSNMIELSATERGSGPPLILLHGLFGNRRNMALLSRALAGDFRVITPDLRNHGRSPHAETMSYPELAADIVALLDKNQLPSAAIAGHSLGGKVAMAAALLHPERIERLAVLDIAPVSYRRIAEDLIQHLVDLPLAELGGRGDADRRLAAYIPDPRVRGFLLQNLEPDGTGLRWRLNLSALRDQRRVLAGFPDAHAPFPGPALFLHGAQSDYVRPEHHAAIRRLFPRSRIEAVPGAGHWLHADEPRRVTDMLREFLGG